jgi:hypothetical protein
MSTPTLHRPLGSEDLSRCRGATQGKTDVEHLRTEWPPVSGAEWSWLEQRNRLTGVTGTC